MKAGKGLGKPRRGVPKSAARLPQTALSKPHSRRKIHIIPKGKVKKMEKGLLFVVSAPAGCGKDTILEQLLKITENVGYSVSATSRAPRAGEVDGVHYHFRTREQFEQMIRENAVLEYTEYCGNYYGTPKKAVEDMLDAGRDVILKIEVEGAMNIKKLFPDCCLVFILPPSMRELERRLRKRGTETEEKIRERTAQAAEELKFAENYDYLIVNGDLSKAVEDLKAVIAAEKLRKSRRIPLLDTLKSECKIQ